MRTPVRFLLAAALCTGCAAQVQPADPASVPRVDVAPPHAAPERAGPSLPELIAQALPSVVLVINYRQDGTTTYGAGMIVSGGGVLTSDHVVRGARSIGVMLHERGRTSYTPMDGGLARFLFENASAVLEARRLSGDANSDLAVLAVDADISAWPVLEMATAEVRPGDIVLSLGHPQGTVWSFTQGVVGALHQGAIQHDSSVSHGSSGGPLLNARGQVIGINIAKVVSEPDGLAFARPISMASRLADGLGWAPAAQSPLDRSTPEAAAVTCWRAQELGLAEVADCFDWEANWAAFQEIAREAGRLDVPPDMRARIEAYLGRPTAKAEWIAEGRLSAARWMTRDGASKKSGPAAPAPSAADLPPEVSKILSELTAAEEKDRRARPAEPAMDPHDPQRLQARLRLGIRVEATHPVTPDRAWVLLAGRNPDGSTYRFSELWAKSGPVWLQRWPPHASDMDQLPAGWAPPIVTFARYRSKKLAHFVRKMAEGLDAQRSAPPCKDTAAAPGTTVGRAVLNAR